jgi:predicted ATPase/predicted negative regulator of RcsB-dependent stress response
VGKTRLALAAVEEVMGDFAHGAWFVPLAGVGTRKEGGRDREALVQAIAGALNLTFSPGGEPRAQLLDYLRHRELLLVLDNLEELLEAGIAFLLDLLRTAPYVTVLVTSRQRLNLQAEQAMRIEGLPVPSAGVDPFVGWDGQGPHPYSSVQLFVERAKYTLAEFGLDRANLPDIVEICRLAEGLPLGIELAASWVEEMAPAAIAQAIQKNLDFLATTRRDVPERHHSIRAVLESSWQLLSEPEQRVLAQAEIFGGDFSQEAALAVTGATEADLESLEEKSLLRLLAPGRYEMHTLLRQFAREKLELSAFPPAPPAGEPGKEERGENLVRARYCDYYLDFMVRREAALYGPEPRQAVEEIQRDVRDVEQAWRWSVEQGQLTAIARSSAVLARFLWLSGLFREGNDLFHWATALLQRLAGMPGSVERDVQRALGRILVEQAGFLIALARHGQAADLAMKGVELARRTQAPEVEAVGCMKWGSALLLLGECLAARAHLERALRLARETGSRWLEAESLRRLGYVEMDLGSYATARVCFERALEIFNEIGDRDGAGTTLDNLGIVAQEQVDYRGSRAYYEQALPIFQETGYRLGQVSTLTNLGTLLIRLGDYAGAREHYEQALRTLREIGGRLGEALLLNNLGNVVHLQGDHEAAYEYTQQSLVIAKESGERNIQGYALDLLGHVLAGLGQYQGATAAYQEALGIWLELGQPNIATESLAGLARVALASGDLAQARQHAGEILDYVEEMGSIAGTDEDFLIYLTCYRVLRATQDPRAREILGTAHALLQRWAVQIADDELRHSFLQNVTVHREIIQAWEEGE